MPARGHAPDDGHTPCLECECCARWGASLEVLAASMKRHAEGEIRFAPCDPECLVCAQIDWRALRG